MKILCPAMMSNGEGAHENCIYIDAIMLNARKQESKINPQDRRDSYRAMHVHMEEK